MADLSQRIANLSPEKRALLERRLAQQQAAEATRARIPRQAREARETFPLSFAQQRLWFLQQFDPLSPLYTIPWAFRLSGPLHQAHLEQALLTLITRHEILRTTYTLVNNQPVQRVAPPAPLPLAYVDLRTWPADTRADETKRLVAAAAAQPFDLTTGPLLRALLVQVADAEYVFLLTLHHIVTDGWSFEIFVRELATVYGGLATGQPATLPELPIQYVDFACWQRDWLQGETLGTYLAYWRKQLRDAQSILELPLDHARPTLQTFQGAIHAFTLPAPVHAAALAFGRESNATLFMTLLAAFNALLHRYTHQTDLLIGTPIAGRNRAETEGLVGFFVNTLVLRTDLTGAPSFRELVRRVRETALDAYAHQDLPFEKLVEDLHPERDLSHTPIFQVTFALQNAPAPAMALHDLTLRTFEIDNGTTKFDLTLYMAEGPDELTGLFEYNRDIFAPETIARLATHFVTLLAGLTATPDAPISSLPLLSPAEAHAYRTQWNATAAPPATVPVHTLVAQHAARTPHALAVSSPTGALTYQALNQRANQLAHHLRALALPPAQEPTPLYRVSPQGEARIALLMDHCPERLIAQLAVLKAGATFVPLDPSTPTERLAFLLADCHAHCVLTQPQHLPRLLALPDSPLALALDPTGHAFAHLPTTDPDTPSALDQLAYLIYTSGSTGTPKGVAIPHAGLANLIAWHIRTYAVSPADRASQLAGPAFDAAVWEAWPYLAAGASVHIVPDDMRLEPHALCTWLAHERITLAFLPTPLAEAVLAEPWPTPLALRAILTGGDALRRRPPADLPFTLINHYGPTEDTVVSTAGPVTPEPAGVLPHIGTPIANTQAYVLDRHGAPVPPGVVGELFVGGTGLARGYFGRPALTAERFGPHPFAGHDGIPPGARLYRTGDLARYTPDGALVFAGRTDDQVKLRGFRIELGEIEAHLTQHPRLAAATVLARADDPQAPNDKRLVAYYVARDASALTPHELQSFLKERLPAYMVPSAFVALDQLPLTPNGKVDRRALPPPADDAPTLAQTWVAPRPGLETVLADVWLSVLPVKRIGRDDNFFELGGHSLLATQVLSRVREVLHVDLPLRRLFENPTLAALAERIHASQPGAQVPVSAEITRVARTQALPLSFAQQRLWFLDHLEPGSALYNLPATFRIGGALDTTCVTRVLNEIVRRHEALRTTFPTHAGQPTQVIADTLTLNVPLTDLSHMTAAARLAEAQRLAAHEFMQPFDLPTGPLVRGMCVRLAPDDHVLIITMHHIVSDGWSQAVFLQEFVTLYQAFIAGAPSPLPELAVQYADFAYWQRTWLRDAVLAQQLDYWKTHLSDAPFTLDLLTDRPRPATQTFHGATEAITLAPALTERLRTLSQQTGTTLFMTVLAAFETLLYRLTGQGDFLIGTPIANRNRHEIEPLIGFFVNTLVLRARPAAATTFQALVRQVRDTTLEAYAHQDLPFEKLVEALQPERDLSRTPLFQIMFTLQNDLTEAEFLKTSALKLQPFEFESPQAKFDLTLSLAERGAQMIGVFEYNTDLFDASTITQMSATFQRVLDALTAYPSERLDALDLLDPTERTRVLDTWNAPTPIPAAPRTIAAAFEAQVARTPDALAAQCEAERYTYHALNAQANRLAHLLRAHGVGPEQAVAVWVERSLDNVVALLAIAKAGGVYVPLDPAYPAERIAFILHDARPRVVLTHAALAARLPASDAQIVELDPPPPTLATYPATDLADDHDPAHLAYVIYTSGSTGTPKGVGISHGTLAEHVAAMQTVFAYTARDRVLQFASLTFDASLEQVLVPLLHGATVIVRGPELWSAREFVERIVPLDLTVFNLPTAYWHQVAQELTAWGASALISRMRLVIVGGDVLQPEAVQLWRQSPLHAVALLNAYGPTETTITATAYAVPTEIDATHGPARLPIGRPLGARQAYVLDAHGRPTPIGAPGELYLGGTALARGYLHRPDLTAEKFVPHPFSAEPGARLYRTGDRVRYRTDGQLEFLGRADFQVKVRGFRVELGEIEAALRNHPSVQDTVVLARADAPSAGGKRLVAYVVLADTHTLDVSALRAHLKAHLPDYMVPAVFVALPALPLNPSGKLDRRALPAPEAERPALATTFVEARTPAEETLGRIWAEVLGLPQVGIHDNFFELGGDSILSIQIIARAGQAGLHLTPKQLFEHQTIATLASVATPTRHIEAEQGPVTGAVPLTPIQQWFFEQTWPARHHFNQSVLLVPARPLTRATLAQSVAALLAHHDALRAGFSETAQGWAQHYAAFDPQAPLPVEEIDLRTLPAAEQAAALEHACTRVQTSLDLGHGPLIKVALLHLSAEPTQRVLIVIHHLVVDGVSWRILLEDFFAAYTQITHGNAPHLPAKTTAFPYWATRLHQHAAAPSPALRAERDYWHAQAHNALSPLPRDFTSGTNQEADAQLVSVALQPEETRTLLQDVAAAFHSQINDALLTAMLEALATWTGAHAFWVDLEGHGREALFDEVDLARTVGWFTTLFPVWLDLGASRDLIARLKAVKEHLRQIPQHGIGYGLLRYLDPAEAPRAALRAVPAPEISFNYLGQFDQVLSQDAPFSPAAEAGGVSRSLESPRAYALEITASVGNGRLQVDWRYSARQYRAETIQTLAERFVTVLRALIAEAHTPGASGYTPSDFPDADLSQDDLDALLAELG